MELDLVIVAVDDLPEALQFWREFSSWSVTVDVPGVYAELRARSGRRFGLYAVEHYVGNLNCDHSDLVHAGLQRTELYLQVNDATAELARADALGAKILAEVSRKPWGDTVGYALVPGGHVLALAQPSP